ncbi:Inositol monophosphatase [Cynara cardunculus var. scolymus]|uniref:Inositol monophosphatase n=1 Tax=Cynara cardunculus var. scolymus TaxID=59895 RepID=A0A118K6E5_CYNCS|nr:Inositol monophosphatase [Cynara cardunculus var. scolymus]
MEANIDANKYAKELEVGVRVVQLVCCLCQKVQKGSIGPNPDQVISKDDDSPVTVADWSVQATVSWMLSELFGRENVSIVAEEDTLTLSDANATSLLASVVATVNESLAMAPRFGLKSPATPLGASEVLDAISRCNSTGGPVGRHWVLDPVDGTLGFVRGDQYAVALALIENGQVMIGVLGCPNYSSKKKLVNNSSVSKLSSDLWQEGKQPLRVYSMVKYAAIARGDAEIYMKFAKAGYKEKIWDHAAGVVIVEEAGGVVTDAGGRPLDFSRGVYLEGVDRGIVACSGVNLHDKIVGAVYASWDSSHL